MAAILHTLHPIVEASLLCFEKGDKMGSLVAVIFKGVNFGPYIATQAVETEEASDTNSKPRGFHGLSRPSING
jgi:hypothetical protein